MIFNYLDPDNLEKLVTASQVLHVVYVILLFMFVITQILSFNKKIKLKGESYFYFLALILFIGIGNIINGVGVIAVKNLQS